MPVVQSPWQQGVTTSTNCPTTNRHRLPARVPGQRAGDAEPMAAGLNHKHQLPNHHSTDTAYLHGYPDSVPVVQSPWQQGVQHAHEEAPVNPSSASRSPRTAIRACPRAASRRWTAIRAPRRLMNAVR